MQEICRTSEGALISKQSKEIILLAIMFAIGMLYGVLFVLNGTPQALKDVGVIANEYSQNLQHQSLFFTFKTSFFSLLSFMLISYFFGFCAIGQPIILLVPAFRGIGLGFFMAQLYSSYGMSAMGFSLLVIVPYALASLFCIIVASREALKLSNMFFGSFASKNGAIVSLNVIKTYHMKMGILLFLAFISAILNALCVFLFSGLFKF